jgi:hypothetical protein
MRTHLRIFAALALVGFASAVQAQPVYLYPNIESVAESASSNTTDQTCMLIKYRGTTAGMGTVEVAAGGDMTLKLEGSADTTTGESANGIFDLSSPAAGVDTMGELVNLINTTGSNWVAVLVGCLASDLTNNTITTISATNANTPLGVPLTRDAAVASATSVFSAQVAIVPPQADDNISFWLSGSPVGSPSGSTRVNTNALSRHQTFITHIREKITSSGTVALHEVLAVKRTYDSAGKVSDVVRVLYAQTGAATTVEGVINFHNGPLVSQVGELIIVRQRTATDLTASQIAGSGYAVVRP